MAAGILRRGCSTFCGRTAAPKQVPPSCRFATWMHFCNGFQFARPVHVVCFSNGSWVFDLLRPGWHWLLVMKRHSVMFPWNWVVLVLAMASIGFQSTSTADHGESGPANASVGSKEPESEENTTQLGMRLREGARITDLVGEFQRSSDRYTFVQEDAKQGIRVLENLALERVSRILEDDPSPRMWSVSGTITEYRGENYLLVTRAVLKPRAVPAARRTETKKETP